MTAAAEHLLPLPTSSDQRSEFGKVQGDKRGTSGVVR